MRRKKCSIAPEASSSTSTGKPADKTTEKKFPAFYPKSIIDLCSNNIDLKTVLADPEAASLLASFLKDISEHSQRSELNYGPERLQHRRMNQILKLLVGPEVAAAAALDPEGRLMIATNVHHGPSLTLDSFQTSWPENPVQADGPYFAIQGPRIHVAVPGRHILVRPDEDKAILVELVPLDGHASKIEVRHREHCPKNISCSCGTWTYTFPDWLESRQATLAAPFERRVFNTSLFPEDFLFVMNRDTLDWDTYLYFDPLASRAASILSYMRQIARAQRMSTLSLSRADLEIRAFQGWLHILQVTLPWNIASWFTRQVDNLFPVNLLLQHVRDCAEKPPSRELVGQLLIYHLTDYLLDYLLTQDNPLSVPRDFLLGLLNSRPDWLQQQGIQPQYQASLLESLKNHENRNQAGIQVLPQDNLPDPPLDNPPDPPKFFVRLHCLEQKAQPNNKASLRETLINRLQDRIQDLLIPKRSPNDSFKQFMRQFGRLESQAIKSCDWSLLTDIEKIYTEIAGNNKAKGKSRASSSTVAHYDSADEPSASAEAEEDDFQRFLQQLLAYAKRPKRSVCYNSLKEYLENKNKQFCFAKFFERNVPQSSILNGEATLIHPHLLPKLQSVTHAILQSLTKERDRACMLPHKEGIISWWHQHHDEFLKPLRSLLRLTESKEEIRILHSILALVDLHRFVVEEVKNNTPFAERLITCPSIFQVFGLVSDDPKALHAELRVEQYMCSIIHKPSSIYTSKLLCACCRFFTDKHGIAHCGSSGKWYACPLPSPLTDPKSCIWQPFGIPPEITSSDIFEKIVGLLRWLPSKTSECQHIIRLFSNQVSQQYQPAPTTGQESSMTRTSTDARTQETSPEHSSTIPSPNPTSAVALDPVPKPNNQDDHEEVDMSPDNPILFQSVWARLRLVHLLTAVHYANAMSRSTNFNWKLLLVLQSTCFIVVCCNAYWIKM